VSFKRTSKFHFLSRQTNTLVNFHKYLQAGVGPVARGKLCA